MKKFLLILVIVMLLSGCRKNEISCIYKDEDGKKMNSYMRITLVYEDDTIVKEKLNAVYQFKSKEEATANYDKIEKVLEKDATVKLRQVEERIAASGEKDVSSMQYDRKTKIDYYEKLGYTCK